MIEDPELRRLFEAESAEHLARLDDGLLRLEKTPADPPLLEDVFRESHSLKGAARMLGLAGIEAAAHGLESLLNAARKGEAPLTPEAIARMNAALVELRRRVREALTDLPTPPAPAAIGAAATVATLAGKVGAGGTAAGEPFRIETVRVETRKLDDLLTQVGELAVIQGRMRHRRALMEDLPAQWAGPEREDGARMEFTVNRLKDLVLALRLLPLSILFALFPRMVRDLAGARDKEAELVLEGGDITVDKRILEEMKDPLMHLVRNAIDHGIEPPAERERLGKPRAGRVRLSAVRKNNSVLLEVRDDGRGLDLEAIRQMAKKRGLLDEATLAAMTPAQLQQLILLPGFSTSTFVTELSGRGVGLDVVRVNVERMKGDIRLESAAGHGLTVQLRLPLSLATTRLLLASVGGRLYGLPIESVHASLRVREADVFTLEGRPAVLLDGQPVIAARIKDLLELPAAKEAAIAPSRGWGEGGMACIVLQIGDDRLGLLADDLVAEEEVVGRPLGAPLRRVRNVSALATLGSGEICAVLNPADLLRSAHKTGAEVRSAELGARKEAARPAILLVEDSALIRAMEKRILEDGGYEVVATVDGMDALDALETRGSRPFAAVVSDILMPNMDGLALTARIRADPRHKDLPVILVTTLASDEDKRRGLEAGANAYLPKPSFDQRVLLETLKRLV
ncbi:MAG: response regulator [Sulfurisoma sp.]|nr:response regulator [Sulfurisoma sp.]